MLCGEAVAAESPRRCRRREFRVRHSGGVCPNVPNGTASIAKYLILQHCEIHEPHFERVHFSDERSY